MDEKKSESRISRYLFVFSLTMAIWLLFTWPFGPVDWSMIVAGAIVALFSGVILADLSTQHPGRALNPVRYFWAGCYVFVLGWWVMLANFDVAFRVLHPDVPIEPGIVKVKTELESDSARAALANSITLTPGTMTVDLTDQGYLYIHWINVSSSEMEAATHAIVGRFEWLLGRIFE